MAQYLLFSLFFVLFASRALGFDLSLAPGLSVKNAFLYLMFLGIAIETAVSRRRQVELLSVFIPFALYVAYAVFTWLVVLLVIDYPGYSARTTLMSLKAGPVENLLVLLIFFYGVTSVQGIAWLLRAVVWLVIVGNVATVMDALDTPDLGIFDEREDGRVGGPIGSSNEYAAFLVLFLPVIVSLYWTEKGLARLLASIGIFLSGLAFLLALSRGAIVGLTVGCVLGVVLLRSIIPIGVLIRAGSGLFVFSILVVAGVLLAGYGDLVAERFGLFAASGFDASSGRTLIWSRAVGSMMEHPLTFITGFGWDAYESSRQFGFATHNAYLGILYNLGMIGIVLFLLTVGNAIRVVRAALNEAAEDVRPILVGFIFGFVALLATLFFGELYSTGLFVWAFVGAALRLSVEQLRITTPTDSIGVIPSSSVSHGLGSSTVGRI